MDHPALLGRANPQTLRKLLTTHVRADCFTEDHLAGTFESGHMTLILKRMAEIYDSRAGESKCACREFYWMKCDRRTPGFIAPLDE